MNLDSTGTWGSKGRAARAVLGIAKIGVFAGRKLPGCWAGMGAC